MGGGLGRSAPRYVTVCAPPPEALRFGGRTISGFGIAGAFEVVVGAVLEPPRTGLFPSLNA